MLQLPHENIGSVQEEKEIAGSPSAPDPELIAISHQPSSRRQRVKNWTRAHIEIGRWPISAGTQKHKNPANGNSTRNIRGPPPTASVRTPRQSSKSEAAQEAKSVLERLTQPERIAASDGIQRLEKFEGSGGAEGKYDDFASYIESPENGVMARAGMVDSMFFVERAVISPRQGPPRSGETLYICFSGFTSVEQAKRLHAELSKRKAREQYAPPLSLCYDLGCDVVRFAAAPDVRLAGERPSDTLCGTLATIGTDEERRIATLGGVVHFEGKLWAMSSGHKSASSSESGPRQVEPLKEEDIDLRDYDDDVTPALITNGATTSEMTARNGVIPLGAGVPTEDPSALKIGDVDKDMQEPDWSLLALSNPLFALPNSVRVGSKVIYLTKVAKKPVSGEIIVMAGASGGNKTMIMEPVSVRFHLPGDTWITAWKLRRGQYSGEQFTYPYLGV